MYILELDIGGTKCAVVAALGNGKLVGAVPMPMAKAS